MKFVWFGDCRIGRESSTPHSGGAPHPLRSNGADNSGDLGTAEQAGEIPPLTPGVLCTPLLSTGKHSTKVNRTFGPTRSFSIVNPRGRQLKEGPIMQLRVVLTLVTWKLQEAPGSSIPHSGGAPHPLRSTGKHSSKVNRAFGPERSFSIVNPRARQLKARLYSSEVSLLLWLGYRRIGRGSSIPRSGGAPHPLRLTGNHSTKVNRAFGPARSFSIVNPTGPLLGVLHTFEGGL